jgi:hypothetical protein
MATSARQAKGDCSAAGLSVWRRHGRLRRLARTRGGSVVRVSPVGAAGPSPRCTGLLARKCVGPRCASGTTNVSSMQKFVRIIAKALENTVRSAIVAISRVDSDLIYDLERHRMGRDGMAAIAEHPGGT